jgi:hypothetical protein
MKRKTSYYIWLAFSLSCLTTIGVLALKLPAHGDERHIIDTIKIFVNQFNFSTIKDYPEVTPPFFFFFYAAWSKVFSSSVESLRILTLVISLITWQLVFVLFNLYTERSKHTLLLSLLVVINPYFWGTSIFVFTDMLTILFCLAAVISFLKDKIILFTIFSILAILCRQYAIIFPLAVMTYWIISLFFGKQIIKTYLIIPFIIITPLILLFFIWGGISPASGIGKWIVPNSLLYNIDYINTYLTFSVIYCFPIVIILIKKTKIEFSNITALFLISIFFYFFPVKSSLATLLQTNYTTVGYAHRAIIQILGGNNSIINTILWMFLLIGIYVNVIIIKKYAFIIHSKIVKKEIIFIFSWIFYLLIMPFSYQVWEKYLILILPFLILSIYINLPYPEKTISEEVIA